MWLRQFSLLMLGGLLSVGVSCMLVVSAIQTKQPVAFLPQEPSDGVIKVQSLPKADIILPTAVADTGLIAVRLSEYDGPFAEDGSYENVFGIAALLVENTTDELILSAQIKLCRGEMELCFYAEMIPPMSYVLIPESRRKVCSDINFTDCTGWVQTGQGSEDKVTFSPGTKGSYIVCNETGYRLNNIAVYHKDKIADIFVGGRANRTLLSGLEPGQTAEVFPSFFSWGSSDIVAVILEME